MSLRARFQKAVLASLFGWIAGLLAATPFQILEIARNAASGGRPFASGLVFALALWLPLTFAVAAYFCGFFVLPVVWIISPARLLAHRGLSVAASGIFAGALMTVRAHAWTALYHDGVSLINYVMWAVYAIAFFLVSSSFYVKFVRSAPAVS
jgi:hypothetical protein